MRHQLYKLTFLSTWYLAGVGIIIPVIQRANLSGLSGLTERETKENPTFFILPSDCKERIPSQRESSNLSILLCYTDIFICCSSFLFCSNNPVISLLSHLTLGVGHTAICFDGSSNYTLDLCPEQGGNHLRILLST